MVCAFTVSMADTAGSANILWHNSDTGAIKYMPLNNMTPESTIKVVSSSNTNLIPKGIADFTGDYKVDILFHNQNSGMLRVWEMDGAVKVNNISVMASSNTNLQVAGTGDFDGDGDNDIATFNTNSGALVIWVMDGTTKVRNEVVLTDANRNLAPRGVGDMDGDGIPDIVLRNNNSGAVRVWTMNGDFSRKGNEYVTGSSNTNLELRGIVDINKDGNNDILNYNTNSGRLRVWLMDGNLAITENAEVAEEADLDWSARGGVVAPIYDGKVWNVANVEKFREALENASINGQNDTIILDRGIYSTTSDGIGTFTFDDAEPYNLTITAAEGLTNEDVILDGDHTDQVFNYNNSENATLILKRISLINANSKLDGGGVYCNHNICVYDCNMSNNVVAAREGGGTVTSGGGFYALGKATVSHSIFSYNTVQGRGGGFLSYGGADISASTFIHHNTAKYDNGGGFYSGGATNLKDTVVYFNNISTDGSGGGFFSSGDININDSSIISNIGRGMYTEGGGFLGRRNVTINNSSIYWNLNTKKGGGFCVGRTAVINNSKVYDNWAGRDGGGFYASNAIVTNSLFARNEADANGDIFYARGISYAANNNFIENEGAIYSQGAFINNIFDANIENIYLFGDSKIYNNYIDYTKIIENEHNTIKRNNLQPVYVGSVKLEDDNLTLMSDSPAIDEGLNPADPVFEDIINTYDDTGDTYEQIKEMLQKDMFGNQRVHSGIIDVGATEYGSGN